MTFATRKAEPDVVVYEGSYPGWPWICRRKSGELVCAFREDSVHGYSPTGKVMFTRSTDGGRTWAQARAIVDEPGIDDRNANIAELSDGTLIIGYNTYDADQNSRPFVIRSRDGGETWESPIQVADIDARTRDGIIQLRNGALVLPIYAMEKHGKGTRAAGSIAALSSDGGGTWTLSRVPNTKEVLGDEWNVLELPDGRLLGMMRNLIENRKGDHFYYRTLSDDGGRTWSGPVKTNVSSGKTSCPAQAFLWRDRAHVLWANSRMKSVRICTCDDPDYVSWNIAEGLSCYIYDPAGRKIPDASYPVCAFVDESKVLIVDYEITDRAHGIYGYFAHLKQIARDVAALLPAENYSSSPAAAGSPANVGNLVPSADDEDSWLSAKDIGGQWIKIDLGKPCKVAGVSVAMLGTMGSEDFDVVLAKDNFKKNPRTVARRMKCRRDKDEIVWRDVEGDSEVARWVGVEFHSRVNKQVRVVEIQVWEAR